MKRRMMWAMQEMPDHEKKELIGKITLVKSKVPGAVRVAVYR